MPYRTGSLHAPRVDYATTGAHLGDRYAAGTVTVTLTVTEKLLSTPFLSMVRTNAAPIPITLTPCLRYELHGVVRHLCRHGHGPGLCQFLGARPDRQPRHGS